MITGIGSFPFTDVDEAIDLIFSTCREIPFWPQLPRKSSRENMYTTFLEGVPSIIVDPRTSATYMDTTLTEGIEKFYEDYSNDNLDAFRITEEAAPGFFRFLERLKEIENDVKYIKCQLTGPFSMGVGLKDENDRSIIYNSAFYDIIKKSINMKARWMIQAIKTRYPQKDVIVFFDEPFMVSFGSAYIPVSREEAQSAFNEVLEGIPAKRGVHVCGNTDWPVLLNSAFDIINYDAYGYLDSLFCFKEDLARFVARGGWMAPGIVPSSPEVANISLEEIKKIRTAFCDKMEEISKGAGSGDYLYTTSCGVGTLTIDEAVKAMQLLKEIA